jgi:hypothetical protein
MNLLSKILGLSLALALTTSACQNCPKCDMPAPTGIQVAPANNNINRGESATNLKLKMATQLKAQTAQIKLTEKFKFEAKMLAGTSISQLEKLFSAGSVKTQNDDNDAALVSSIFSTLMAAENKADALEITFAMASEPAEDGYVIFGITSEVNRDLELQMFNEATFEMVAANKLLINKGTNYKALNVKEFSNGVYLIKIVDSNKYAELIQRVEIVNSKEIN